MDHWTIGPCTLGAEELDTSWRQKSSSDLPGSDGCCRKMFSSVGKQHVFLREKNLQTHQTLTYEQREPNPDMAFHEILVG